MWEGITREGKGKGLKRMGLGYGGETEAVAEGEEIKR